MCHYAAAGIGCGLKGIIEPHRKRIQATSISSWGLLAKADDVKGLPTLHNHKGMLHSCDALLSRIT